MCNTVAYYNWCPVCPWAVIDASSQLSRLYIGHGTLLYRIYIWPVQVNCSDSATFLCTSSLTQHEPLKVFGLVLSTAQQQPKLQCVISIILALNPKYSSVPATRKKMNSIPAKTRTKYYKSSSDSPQRISVFLAKSLSLQNRAGPEAADAESCFWDCLPTHCGSCIKCTDPQRSK